MADVTAALVKELRNITGAGMMDCKKALNENDANIESSIDWLRSQGLAAAAKKSGRAASEGLVAVLTSGGKGAIIELNSETDFVARNETFQAFAESICKIALDSDGDVKSLKTAAYENGGSVDEQLTHQIATIGENMDLRRSSLLEVQGGVVVSYMHNAIKAGLGKIGVLVSLESSGDEAELKALGKQIAMHIAAANPLALNRNNVNQADLEREKLILTEQARDSGKPEEIVEKMVEGRLRKYYSEICLLEQSFVINPDITVEKAVEAVALKVSASIKVTGFVRFSLGDGVEKEEEDFAAEVAAVAGGS
jgi:elongation factor Ts